ncbi:uncharacterized protein [Nicotiana sylvestris]|uniref:uncharacterized protein n=1 Tax=Nicotiana sylvestris TaxID=4096 RepID=UPI00388CE303
MSNVAPSSSSQQGDSTSSRVNRFLQLEPLVFTGANPEDPPNFINEMHRTIRVMRATEAEGVDLATNRLKRLAYSWFELWAARAAEFENPKQGSKSVWEYHMVFARLSKYVIHIFPIMEARVRRFVQGLNPLTIMNSNMNYGKMIAFTQSIESRKLKNGMERDGNSKDRSRGNMGESLGGGRLVFREESPGSSQSVAQSSFSAQPSGPTQQQWSHFKPGQGNRGSHQWGRSARITPAPAGRGAARGGAYCSGGPNRFYVMSGRQTTEASLDVVTGILAVQYHDVYALIDPSSTLSYVTPFVAMEFGVNPD